MVFENYTAKMLEIENEVNHSSNIFKILRLQEYETRHSNFLSWLFDINGSHRLGQEFAHAFFKECFGENKIDCNKITSVRTEVRLAGEEQKKQGNDKRRIDILIEGKDFTCTIENKYGTTAHDGQCLAYREYIEGRKNATDNPNGGAYPIKDGWKNYFVFLDIDRPDDFDKKHKEIYGDYTFVDYRKIKGILEELIREKADKTDNLEIFFIKQYIEILKEKYTPLSSNLEKICREIPKDDVIEIIAESEKNETLTDTECLFASIVKKYYKENKRKNDEQVRSILDDIVRDPQIIKDDYGIGQKTKEVKYAYALKIFEDQKDKCSLLPSFKKDSQQDVIKTIDFNVSKGLNIGAYFGMNTNRSRNLINYISKNDDQFLKKIYSLCEAGWNCKLVFSILKSHGNVSHTPSNTVCELEHIFFKENDYSKLTDFIKRNAYEQVGARKNTEVRQYLNDLRELGYFEKSQDAEQKMNEYIEKIYNARKKNDKETEKDNIELVIHWLILLDYSLVNENGKIYNITDDNRNFVKQTFKTKTIEALNLFDLGDTYAKEAFK